MPQPQTPAAAWQALTEGNERFVALEPLHPNQGVEHRAALAKGQAPFAIILGCSDSRVAAEMIFDQGLGDLFVVRTAGHVVDSSVLGSLEFGVGILNIPLVVVLGHDGCGAVGATVQASRTGEMPMGYVRDIVERVMPSVLAAQHAAAPAAAAAAEPVTDAAEREHVRNTARLLADRSVMLREAVEAGRLGIVACIYQLAQGQVQVVETVGPVGD